MLSLNARAERKELKAWSSWSDGRPPGFFSTSERSRYADFYGKNGFLVLEDALSQGQVEEIRAEATQICRGARGEFSGMDLASPDETDDEVLRRFLCIHFPHKVSPPIYHYLDHPSIVDSLTAVIGPNVKCMQSMLFIKAAGKPGQAWHQDEIYIPTRDRSLTGAWIALDDATVENGCLWVIPGSHQRGVLYLQEWHADPRFDCALEAKRFPYSGDDAVPVEVRAGSVVFFNGYLLHRSLPNSAPTGFRRSLVNHYMSAESLLPWYGFDPDTPVASADYRDIVMVAGEDPYAFLGTTDTAGPHVRPDGKGGCGNFKYNEKVKAVSADEGSSDH